ncbi:hypothetical protein Leryth_019074 [Lithospermum erythrorhizon]|nr:hypothetical protein Leryth_019074 [Lithospermum erythrorhizon]
MSNHHFLLLSLPAQSHINPTLQLAKLLVRRGARVTFATTSNGLKRMKNLPKLEGLYMETFFQSSEDRTGRKDAVNNYLEEINRVGPRSLESLLQTLADGGHPVTFIVYTIVIPWAATVAHQLQVKSALLFIQCATSYALYHRFFNSLDGLADQIREKTIEKSMISVDIPGLPTFSCKDIPTFLFPDDQNHSSVSLSFQDHMLVLGRDLNPKPLVLINTYDALEKETLEVFEKFNVVPVGPLIPSAFSDGEDLSDKSYGCDFFECDKDYLSWLGEQEDGSVVYASFGSLVNLKKEEKEEIFHGLADSGRPFLWVVRSLSNGEENEMKTMLKENGLIVPWCSQIEVLDHKAIGCFVTHCGWNSTMESIVAGVPVIGFSFSSDQPTNAKLIEEVWCNGVRAKANEKGLVEKDELRRCLDVVMGSEEIKRNALKWRDLALEAVKEGGSSYNNLKLLLN